MRDFLPEEKARREHVLAAIRRVYSAHGFDEIETPVMEDSDRLHAGLGGDNEKLAFAVLRRGLTADQLHAASDALDLADLGLRFDLTVPLTRFYASHRAELPTVFRSIQIAPVWRAERPQRGRYRQFVQCDIDVIGESGPLAEIELITATVATLRELGLDGCTIRINDRRILSAMLDALGFLQTDHEAVLITIDKLDKVGHAGVVAELAERGFGPDAVAALHAFFTRPRTDQFRPFGDVAVREALPTGIADDLISDLVALGTTAAEASGGELVFDPFLVRGMGYYTGAIFEIAHPRSASSLGGGGRYDGMIGRFLGDDVPAAGFSIGFERIVDMVEVPAEQQMDAAALVYDADVAPSVLMTLKAALLDRGARVRLERRPRNMRPLLVQLAASGFTSLASVTAATRSLDDLEFRPIG